MDIKRTILISLLIGATLFCKAQNLPIVNLLVSDSNAAIRTLDLPVREADLSINLNGTLMVNYPWAYLTFYTKVDGENIQGNISSVDGVAVTYYTKFDGFDNIGKVKSVGNITITYYDRFDNKINFGKLKSIGETAITYNDQFDGFDNVGKIKSIGQLKVAYYDRFDHELNGKLKSIGDITLSYHDQFSDTYLNGKLKAVVGKVANVHLYHVPAKLLND